MRPRAITHRRGTTLIEGLMASVLLATSVVGISGSMLATYQNQTQLHLRREASGAGRKVMETVTALPMDPAANGQASLADYQAKTSGGSTSTTTVSTGTLLGGVLSSVGITLLGPGVTTTTTTTTTSGSTSSPIGVPAVLVERRSGLTGTTTATGDFALVTITVPTTGAQAPVQLKRLVTAVEAAANQTK